MKKVSTGKRNTLKQRRREKTNREVSNQCLIEIIEMSERMFGVDIETLDKLLVDTNYYAVTNDSEVYMLTGHYGIDEDMGIIAEALGQTYEYDSVYKVMPLSNISKYGTVFPIPEYIINKLIQHNKLSRSAAARLWYTSKTREKYKNFTDEQARHTEPIYNELMRELAGISSR